MKITVERVFNNIEYTCDGWSHRFFDNVLKDLIYQMNCKINHPFNDHNLRFVMNSPFYREYFIRCKYAPGFAPDRYRGIEIFEDPSLYTGDTQSPYGIVRLIYEEVASAKPHIDHVKINGPVAIVFWKDGTKTVVKHEGEPEMKNPYEKYCVEDVKTTYQSQIKNAVRFYVNPHIDHVIFNGPATIVFWKDGTKTVVKYDDTGFKDYRKAILYAFIRKIYGEGRAYHDILNEIEEVIKQELWMPLPEKGAE